MYIFFLQEIQYQDFYQLKLDIHIIEYPQRPNCYKIHSKINKYTLVIFEIFQYYFYHDLLNQIHKDYQYLYF